MTQWVARISAAAHRPVPTAAVGAECHMGNQVHNPYIAEYTNIAYS
jgi:hypothetical protein